MSHSTRRNLLLAGLAALIALFAYLITLAPSVAPGDVAELQYIPYRLGIPHPNGYPFYILLGRLWSLLPLGTLAWRMNLLSAVLAAGSVAALFGLLRLADLPAVPAACGALAWGFERSFWSWAGLAHRYTLLMLLGIALLACALAWRRTARTGWLIAGAGVFGLLLATHITAPLFLLPALVLAAGPRQAAAAPADAAAAAVRSPRRSRAWLAPAALACLLPLALYAYIPLRGDALWAQAQTNPFFAAPDAVLHGLIHPRFAPTLGALRGYLTAGNPVQLADLWPTFRGHLGDLGPLALQEFGAFWLALGGLGCLLALRRSRPWGSALLVLLVADVVFGVYYWQGNVEAYFLPADLAIVLGLAEVLLALYRAGSWLRARAAGHGAGLRLLARGALPLAVVAGLALPVSFAVRNAAAANHRDDLALDHYWRVALALPLEQGAGLIAHWSDLTPLWYFQQVEAQRPDLLGLYLPEPAQVEGALAAGQPLYLAGPLSGWYADLPWRARLVPWGPLVRLSANDRPAPEPPAAAVAQNVVFSDTVRLTGATLPAQPAPAGEPAALSLNWATLRPLNRDTHISLRLEQGGVRVWQQDDRLVSPWFPAGDVAAGLDFWSRHELRVPAGLAPGDYTLQMVVYALYGPELPPAGGGGQVTLGQIHVAAGQPASWWPPRVTLGNCLALAPERPLDATADAGGLLDTQFLWLPTCQPAGGSRAGGLALTASDDRGSHTLDTLPLDSVAPPGGWQPGQWARTRASVRLPADLPAGTYRLAVAVVDAQGRNQGRHLGPLPWPGPMEIGRVTVTIRPHETTLPPLAQRFDATFGSALRLAGGNIPATAGADQPIEVQLAWQDEQPVRTSYTVFLHLLDGAGQIAAQADAVPHNGTLPTNVWLPGEVVTDTYRLAPAAPLQPGVYTLYAGLYDAATGQRLPLTSGAQSGQDQIQVGKITVN